MLLLAWFDHPTDRTALLDARPPGGKIARYREREQTTTVQGMNLSIRSGLHTIRDAARSQLWPVPTAGVVLAMIVGVVLPMLDRAVDGSLPEWLQSLIFGGDAGAARTVLDAVSSSLITVTSLTFSLTVVTLQLASSQFSPRLLRTFTQDQFVQRILALFLATFTFSLTVLRIVRSPEQSSDPFVPRISVSIAFLMAMASVVGLVLFLAHLARIIRVETMLDHVHEDTRTTLRSNLNRLDTEAADDANAGHLSVPTGADRLCVGKSGFLNTLDHAGLVKAAKESDVMVWIENQFGDFIVEGTPMGSVWHTDGSPIESETREQVRSEIKKSVYVGRERTAAQDVSYGLRQLTDVALKALSPGINDPTTAVHAMGHITAVLAELQSYQLGPMVLRDDAGFSRVVLNRPTFEMYLNWAINQIRHYGSADPSVMTRLYNTLLELSWNAREGDRDAILTQLERLDRTVAAVEAFDSHERDGFAELYREIKAVLAHREV